MKGFIMLVFLAGILFSGTKLALADESHENNTHHEATNHTTDSEKQNQNSTDTADIGMNHSHEMDHSDMSEMNHSNMSEMDHSNMSEMDHSNMTEEEHQNSQYHEENNGEGHDTHNKGVDVQVDTLKGGHQHSHGGGEAIVEKPANVKVLGTFGAINLSFVIIGIWTKWFRGREE